MTDIKKPLPIGQSFFDTVIEKGYYYVDKTLFIRDLLDTGAAATLCTRPRRFGKTLNQTMLKCFFEDTAPFSGKDTRALFKGLNIERAGERYLEHQGKYPVIFLSFKEAKRRHFEDSYSRLKDELVEEFKRHRYACEQLYDDQDSALFEKLASGMGNPSDYSTSLKFLCKILKNYHNQKVIILIDEYDVPLENAWLNGFYGEMIDFIRPLLSSALKDNQLMQLAVITGCLRISRESIFTGLNNLDSISILAKNYSEHFGFTQEEMDAMLVHYGLMSNRQILKDWYDGYLFGNTEVYNPWSGVLAVSNWVRDMHEFPRPFWANTSGNDIVRSLVDRASSETKAELETLLAGLPIAKKVQEDITYDEVYKNVDNLWNFLFFTGYLKRIGEGRLNENGELTLDLSIPNIELRYIYSTKIQELFNERLAEKNLDAFFTAILDGDAKTFQCELETLLLESISYMDSAENFYHGFVAGILSRLNGYRVKSNRESGQGRSDLILYAESRKGKAINFEFKVAKTYHDLPAACNEALQQIEDNNYAAYWINDGYANILKYGIGFHRKDCEVRVKEG